MSNRTATHLANCRFGGELQERLARAHARLMELQPILYTHPVHVNYGMAEFAANWIDTMVMQCEYDHGESKERLLGVLTELLGYQQDYGGFAQQQNPETMSVGFWVGDARGLIGLLAAYRYFQDSRYLHAAKRAGDAAMQYWPADMKEYAAAIWEEHPSVKLEIYFALFLTGFAELYRVTKEQRYLSFARKIFSLMPRLTPDTFPEHADGRMFVLFGAMDLYEATGEREYLAAALHDQQIIAKHFQWLSGGIPELFPDNWRDEACQTANWLRVNLRLWRLTGNDEFLTVAERTWRNHLYLNQHSNGGFCWGRTLREGGALGQGRQGEENGEVISPIEMFYCCSETGPRALLDVGSHAVCDMDGNPAICFWSAGTYTSSGGEITIHDDLEPCRPVRAECVMKTATRLNMRIPHYMQLASLSINGRECHPAIEGQWMVEELPAGKHTVLVAFEGSVVREEKQYPKLRPLTGDVNNPNAKWHEDAVLNFSDTRTAVFYGPWMMKSDVTETCWFLPNRRFAERLRGHLEATEA